LLREEKTKVTEMLIRNPYNKYRPSRIIAINIQGGYVETNYFLKLSIYHAYLHLTGYLP
jgi:hypothetical protein